MNVIIDKKQSETSFENIIVLIMILVLVTISVHQYLKITKYAEMAAYKEDVERLNAALILYRLKHGRFPENLSILASGKYSKKEIINGKLKYIKSKFIGNIKLDSDGYPLSPFGTRFIYNKKEGRVLTR